MLRFARRVFARRPGKTQVVQLRDQQMAIGARASRGRQARLVEKRRVEVIRVVHATRLHLRRRGLFQDAGQTTRARVARRAVARRDVVRLQHPPLRSGGPEAEVGENRRVVKVRGGAIGPDEALVVRDRDELEQTRDDASPARALFHLRQLRPLLDGALVDPQHVRGPDEQHAEHHQRVHKAQEVPADGANHGRVLLLILLILLLFRETLLGPLQLALQAARHPDRARGSGDARGSRASLCGVQGSFVVTRN